MNVNVTREENFLIVRVPLERPFASKSGKTLVVASSHGVVKTGVSYRKKPISVVLNAFIYPADDSKAGGN